MSDLNKTCSDGSIVLHYFKIDPNTLEKEKIASKWDMVFGVTDDLPNAPLKGKYLCIGSGSYIIITDDSIYEWYSEFDRDAQQYKGFVLKRCNPLTLLWVIDIKQSDDKNIDDYISYAKIMTKML
jgi:hypothetical protein